MLSVPTRRGKGTKVVAVASGDGSPVAVSVESAGPAEGRLVEGVLGDSFPDTLPARLIGDKIYDSDGLETQLAAEYGIELIAPNRRRCGKTQDRRPLRRYKRRWKVERLFARLHNFRRLVTRWERHTENFLGLVQIGCLKILLRGV